MKWFKHHTDAHNNMKLQVVIEKFGMEGYGLYWVCVELVGREGVDFRILEEKSWLSYLRRQSGISEQTLNSILMLFGELSLIDNDSLSMSILYLPKLQERSDDYTEKVRRKYGQPTDNVRLEEKRREEKRIEKNIHLRFTSFWNEYPKKAGKVVAERAFNRLNPSKALFDKVLEDIRQRKQSYQWQKEKGKFILNPATYLSQRRWEDETKLLPKEKKPYYEGMEMRKDERGKWWVLHEGKRLEFAGNEKDIIYV